MNRKQTQATLTVLLLVLLTATLVGCASKPSNETVIRESRATLSAFVDRDPGLQGWIDSAHGYAVFPSIGKAGFWVGGSFGRGVVFERGEPIGRTSSTQGTFGPQIGAQSFSQVIFFQDEAALRTFMRGNFEFSAQASGVVASAGAATTTSYERGVAVFLLVRGGLMAEATIGGQRFSFEPL